MIIKNLILKPKYRKRPHRFEKEIEKMGKLSSRRNNGYNWCDLLEFSLEE